MEVNFKEVIIECESVQNLLIFFYLKLKAVGYCWSLGGDGCWLRWLGWGEREVDTECIGVTIWRVLDSTCKVSTFPYM